MSKSRKIYCYVDEAGQDDRSSIFVVVSVVNEGLQQELYGRLLDLENSTRVGVRKWHQMKRERQMQFLEKCIDILAPASVVVGRFYKPLDYYEAVTSTVASSLLDVTGKYRAVVIVDGIDKKKAEEMTKLLRGKGLRLEMVRSGRDETNAYLRLADRWAGCARAVVSDKDNATAEKVFRKAVGARKVVLLPEQQ